MRSFHIKAAVITGCFIFALALLAPPFSQGDEWNLATKFRINRQAEVPGMVLQADTPYVIRLYDSPSERKVVQVYNEDQTKLLTMFIAIGAERLEPTDKTLFTFMETAPQYPLPIKEWFYPGRLNGLEFVYPKEQREEIARHSLTAVTETASVTKSETVAETPKVEEAAPAEPAVEQEQAAQQENQDLNQPVEIAQNTEPAIQEERPAEPAAVTTDEKRELPRTAGELPLTALIGMLCLGAGLGLKVISTKS
jgi:hypothetical protein